MNLDHVFEVQAKTVMYGLTSVTQERDIAESFSQIYVWNNALPISFFLFLGWYSTI